MDELRQYIDQIGGVKPFSRLLGVSDSLIYHILNGRRSISKGFAQRAHMATNGKLDRVRLLFGKGGSR